MSLVIALSKTVQETYPNLTQMSEKRRSEIINDTLRNAIKTALLKIKLPQLKDAFQRRSEEYKFDRGGKHYQQTHKAANYALLERLLDLHTSSLKTDFTDFKIGKELEVIRPDYVSAIDSSSQNQSRKSDYDASKVLNTDPRKKVHLFKTDEIEESVFTTPVKLRNQITKFKFKLDVSNVLIQQIIQINGGSTSLTFDYKQTIDLETIKPTLDIVTSKKTKFTESLFFLYDLHSFIEFVRQLESYSRKISDKEIEEGKLYAYKVLREFFLNLMTKYGKKIKKLEQIENEILLIDDFMSLDLTNPLMEGMELLLNQSIDLQHIKNLAENFDI